MSLVELNGFTLVDPVCNHVLAVIEDRVRFSSPAMFLASLRCPRVFVHVGEGGCHWMPELPPRLVAVGAGVGWPIGACAGRVLESRVLVSSDAEVSDASFAFGLERQLREAEVLICGTGSARAFWERCGRKDLARCTFDVAQVWKSHRARVRACPPEFGNNYAELVSVAESASRLLSGRKRLSPADQLECTRSVTYAILLCVALKAQRGDYS